MSLETSIELLELQGRGGGQGTIQARTPASWRAASMSCTTQALEDRPPRQEPSSMGHPTSETNNKARPHTAAGGLKAGGGGVDQILIDLFFCL